MQDNLFSLTLPDGDTRYLTIGWLFLALSSLVLAGLFTLIIVLSRTPFFQEFIPWLDFFHTALVVHVDLTVLVWLLSFAGVLWSINSNSQHLTLGKTALFFASVGTIIITLSPFTGEGNPSMNNYVPVLQNTTFFIGLYSFGLGFSLLILRSFLTSRSTGKLISGEGALHFALYTTLLTSLIAVLSLALSYLGINQISSGEVYFDRLFWGSGHIIQFSHTLLMLTVWLWLANIIGDKPLLPPRAAMLFFAIGMSPTLGVPYIYANYDVNSNEHLTSFFHLMKYGGGLAAFPIGLAVFIGLIKNRKINLDHAAERNALIYSMLLFGIGGIIGYLIIGSNVTIPAHYHGSIVGVTLAYMGLTYYLLPKLGFRKIKGRLAEWQPAIYGVGQLMHILGLAWSGGYGVSRKTAEGFERIEQIAGMALMGLGGLISIVGGLIFLIVVFISIKPDKT